MSLWGELKRRKMLQVAAAYAVVSWLLVQIVSTIESPLNLPEWFDTAVIVLLAIGFPITVIISWAFNLTPDGLVRDKNDEYLPPRESKRIEIALVALLAVAIGWIGYREFVSEPPRAEGRLPNSIAVLSCANFSTDPANEYFAPSLHEEILNQLVKLSKLNVIARTSVLQYDEAAMPIPQIAQELNVRSVMECSVAYADGRVVISTQLIDGETGLHLWSNRYNEPFADVFAIQADIAMNVANALAVEFSSEEQAAIERIPTESPAAYAFFLQAIERINDADLSIPLAFLERALDRDPRFARAHALKAVLYAGMLINSTGSAAVAESERSEIEQLARDTAELALSYDPNDGIAYDALGRLDAFTWRWSDALQSFERAVAGGVPGGVAAWIYAYAGQPDDAKAIVDRASALNPLSSAAWVSTGVTYGYAGEPNKAIEFIEKALELNPTEFLGRAWLSFMRAAIGDREAALEDLEFLEQFMGSNRPLVILPELAYAYGRIGRSTEAQRVHDEIIEASSRFDVGNGAMALAALAIGHEQTALEWLERAAERIRNHEFDTGFYNLMMIKTNALADPILEKPEFVDMRNRLAGD